VQETGVSFFYRSVYQTKTNLPEKCFLSIIL